MSNLNRNGLQHVTVQVSTQEAGVSVCQMGGGRRGCLEGVGGGYAGVD